MWILVLLFNFTLFGITTSTETVHLYWRAAISFKCRVVSIDTHNRVCILASVALSYSCPPQTQPIMLFTLCQSSTLNHSTCSTRTHLSTLDEFWRGSRSFSRKQVALRENAEILMWIRGKEVGSSPATIHIFKWLPYREVIPRIAPLIWGNSIVVESLTALMETDPTHQLKPCSQYMTFRVDDVLGCSHYVTLSLWLGFLGFHSDGSVYTMRFSPPGGVANRAV